WAEHSCLPFSPRRSSDLLVIEYQNLVGDRQENIRRPQYIFVFAGLEVRFDIAHAVIGKIAHQTAGKTWQARQLRSTVAQLELFNKGQCISLRGFFDDHTITLDADALTL